MQDITDHPYSAHSRRPAQCRICKAPAGMHSASEASHMSLWKSLRYPLVTDRFQGYSARTLGVLTSIAAQGGDVDSWDLNNRGWHKTAVAILIKDLIIVELNPDTHPGQYTLSEAGRQVCAWHGIEITTPDVPVVETPADTYMICPACRGVIIELVSDMDGEASCGCGYQFITAEDIMSAMVPAQCATIPETDDTWTRAESAIWEGTGTVVRTRPRSFRKVKNTRSSRARRGGAR